jgi:hypothetical protein
MGATGVVADASAEVSAKRDSVWLWRVAVVAVIAPIVLATLAGLVDGWQPLSDNGILIARSRDVATGHHPLLGSSTSASLVLGTHLNNLGPLYFDLVALPVKVLGPWVGAPVGVMLVNVASVALALVFARRLGGLDAVMGVALALAGLQWAMRGELLFDIWPPNALVLPFFAFIVLVAALAAADLVAAPWLVVVASVLVQTHMSHVPLVAVLGLGAMVAAWVRWRAAESRANPRRSLVACGIVAIVAWSQPLLEQFAGSGRGNLSRVVDASGSTEGTSVVGPSRAVRIVAEVFAAGPWFRRSSYADAVPITPVGQPIDGLISLVPAMLLVVVVLAVLVAVVLANLGAERRGLTNLSMVSVAAVVVGLVALSSAPVNPVGMSAHQMRWLWSIAAVCTAGVLATVFAMVRTAPRRLGSWPAMAACGLLVVVGAAGLPGRDSDVPGPMGMSDELDTAQELVRDLDQLDGRGTVLFDVSTLRFLEPYSGLVFAEMQDRGIPFVFDDEIYVRQFGEGRRDEGQATLRLWEIEGDRALTVPPGAERVGFARGSDGPVALFVEPI